MLYLLYQSNEKQKEIIKEHDIEINNHQNMILSCLSNIKNLYQESQDIKNDILLEDKKLNSYMDKTDKEMNNLKLKCQEGISQINILTDVLNSHTQILAEHSTTIAQLQALSIKNTEKIEQMNNNIINNENKIRAIEGRLDRVEMVLKEHQKILNSLTNDIKEMKEIVNNIVQRIEKLETKLIEERAESKAEKIEEILEKFDEDKLYEFSEFILDMRNQPEPFNLDDIIKIIKIILNKKNKKTIKE